ncbi:MAG: Zn-dependent alcohol dehydrogenase [Deltaproteobacteria bacterium]|jgi:S-(hydroxymethyl)glutathione dehydrogenase/alcohol dehydrogenase|nr:Zn-dependent alcohol dehydrogenase [Deltaproteobacteria bacterium]
MFKAAVMYNYNEPLKIESVDLKPPREDEVVVKVVASGICHSDLSVIKGNLPMLPPTILGHEGAGIVEEVGKAVTNVTPGDHVVLSWVPDCGRCHFCVAGKPHLCERLYLVMMEGREGVFLKDGMEILRFNSVSSFSERTLVREDACIKIQDDAPLDRACLVGCGVMTGVGAAINTAKVRPGQTVAVFGCGGVGLNVIQGAALCAAGKIIAVDLVDQKLQWAKEFGATDVVNGKDVDAVDAIRSLTNGLGVDYAFEVIGAPAPITQAFMSIKRGGAAVLVGVPPFGQEISLPAAMIPLEEKSLLGSLYGSANMRRDIPNLIGLYMQKRLKLDELISRRIKLDEVNAAFEAMEKGEVARSVIMFD